MEVVNLVEDAKRRLEAERRDVLRELRKAAREEQRVREQAQERRRRVRGLIDRGRNVDVPVTEMADALGVTRQAVYALSAAKGWRHDAGSAVRKGTLSAPTRQTLNEAAEAWLEGAKRGVVLTRSGLPYKPAVIRGYEADLRRYVTGAYTGAHRG